MDGIPAYVLKIANTDVDPALLEAQAAMMERMAEGAPEVQCPRPVPDRDGAVLGSITAASGTHLVRVLTWVPGVRLAERPRPPETLRGLGRLMGRTSKALAGFDHPALTRRLAWDLAHGLRTIDERVAAIADDRDRQFVLDAARDFEGMWAPLLQHLPMQVLHNDANDHNVLLTPLEEGRERVTGLIDFGDAVRSYRVAELAIAGAYAMLGASNPVEAVAQVAAGFDAVRPLADLEVRLLLPLVQLRMLVSVVMSASQRAREPENAYLSVSEDQAWVALGQLDVLDFDRACDHLRAALGRPTGRPRRRERRPAAELSRARANLLLPSLSLSYDEPLHIVRGEGTRLYDAEGRAYLDCVNNVCHVGHGHPTVVRALAAQARVLNTNSRYLHDLRVEYAQRLAGTLPDGLDVCAFVSSGSEANELALRLARSCTGRRDLVVLEGGYHGNTSTLVEASHYKFEGKGGSGRPDWVQVAPLPDPYRGRHRVSAVDSEAAASGYAEGVREALARAEAQGGAAAFLSEAIPSCGGQIVPPTGYLAAAYAVARTAGAVCIADEVQTGFGRVGNAFWAFEAEGARPDVVTMGKPIGNGHPLGAVVTTREIADAFAGGMEYFATFGGNPVSCAVGLAVLDVIEAEGLQENAARVGAYVLGRLSELGSSFARVGDVRGRGLFLGVELVDDPHGRTPDAALAHRLVQSCRKGGVLLSTDGPDHNVIKIKPPLVFSTEDADLLVDTLAAALAAELNTR